MEAKTSSFSIRFDAKPIQGNCFSLKSRGKLDWENYTRRFTVLKKIEFASRRNCIQETPVLQQTLIHSDRVSKPHFCIYDYKQKLSFIPSTEYTHCIALPGVVTLNSRFCFCFDVRIDNTISDQQCIFIKIQVILK